MEFSTTTFILEIINFLVLIWILQRLFYKPLLEMIAKRKQHIDQSLEKAKKLHDEAEEQRRLYENRQQLWEQEKKAAQSELHQQFEVEKSAQLEKLRRELEQERQKANVTLTRQQEEFQQHVEKQALENGARFAGLILQQTAGPEVENRLFDLLIDQLAFLPEAAKSSLQLADSKKSLIVKVSSAYLLSNDQRQQLEQKLGLLISPLMNFQYQQDTALIAGVRIDIGAWVLQANVRQELAGFAEIAYESE
ncbi:ATP synthase subunit b [Candidatus Methylobacter favarea]|uniref:ATP synthase subunit b n=1 Tax=Candidatus Methylobacter favarea TaxID=2707345 RepID=A0A8S0Y6J9_9GAMM|nr:F0F1 ATP synthase subunit delta [Candidatus Methylobacter favarea]CAA9891557.1 ATP synthase subunit b [Candidatus Methylobacter favarea]